MIRIRTLSVPPPMKAARAPMTEPMTIANPTVSTPTRSETRAPYTTRLKTSRPLRSTPK